MSVAIGTVTPSVTSVPMVFGVNCVNCVQEDRDLTNVRAMANVILVSRVQESAFVMCRRNMLGCWPRLNLDTRAKKLEKTTKVSVTLVPNVPPTTGGTIASSVTGWKKGQEGACFQSRNSVIFFNPLSVCQWVSPVVHRNPPLSVTVVFATWRVVVVDGATGVAKATVPAPVGPTAWETKRLGTRSTMSAWEQKEAIHLKTVTSPALLLDGAAVEVPAESTANLMRVGQTTSGLAMSNQSGALGIEMCTLQTKLSGHPLTIGKRTTTTMLSVLLPTKASVVNGSPFPGYPLTMVVKNNDCSMAVNTQRSKWYNFFFQTDKKKKQH